jgi:hypothetical protein
MRPWRGFWSIGSEMKSQLLKCAIGAGLIAILSVTLGVATGRAQESEARRKAYDTLLDANVRDGLVYYRAL